MSTNRRRRTGSRRAAALALAASVTAAGTGAWAQSAPARTIDESELVVRLETNRDGNTHQSTYRFVVHAPVSGNGNVHPHDILRVDWKQGGRVLASQRCMINRADGDFASVDCRLENPTLTAFGAVQADIVYMDEQAHQEQLLRTMNLRVGRYWQWSGMNGNRPIHEAVYQVIGDDLLSVGWLWIRPAAERGEYSTSAGPFPRMLFSYWYSGHGRPGRRNEFMRCTVDGQALGDIHAYHNDDNEPQLEAGDRQHDPHGTPNETVYGWYHTGVRTDIWVGARPTGDSREVRNFQRRPNWANEVFTAEHPGQWVCGYHMDADVVREFRFTVNPDGTVAPGAQQQGPNAISIPESMRLVDMRIPNPDPFDASVQPAVMRAAGPWGHPWANPQAVEEGLRNAPTVGRSEPAPPPGVQRGGAAGGAGGDGRARARRH